MSISNQALELDSYEPDYERKCDICGHSPIVTGVKYSQVVIDTGMCGACTWGEADCLWPENW